MNPLKKTKNVSEAGVVEAPQGAITGKKKRLIKYDKYGYLFILPFFIVYAIFSLLPLIDTFKYSLYEYYVRNRKEVINYDGLNNYKKVLGLIDGEEAYFLKYLGNTLRLWIFNFVPQILLSLLVAAWLTDNRIKLKGKGLFKILVYMPNIITAASISMMFAALLGQIGPIMSTLKNWGWISQDANLMTSEWGTGLTISFILFWMWYGNTTLLIISGMMGIDASLYEAADIDGAGSWRKFVSITLPLLKPVMVYVLITSAIGGLQLYDIPAMFNAEGGVIGHPNDSSTTVAMYIMRLRSSDPGRASAVSILLFLITLVISIALFISMRDRDGKPNKAKAKKGGAKK